MKIEVWSDIMCPFCYIGKRNYEAALDQFADKAHVELEWKSFQLDPSIDPMPTQKNVYTYLAERKGMSYEQVVAMHEQVKATARKAGLEYDFDRAVVSNSFNAHRIIQMAKLKGLGDQAEERFFAAYFTRGENLSDGTVLTTIGKDIGLSEEEVRQALNDGKYAQLVQNDIAEAQEIGVTGVPFFVVNRKYAISGAQPIEVFVQTIEQAYREWQAARPSLIVEHGASGPSCTPDGHCD